MDHLGIDVHKKESQIYILAEDGEISERRIRTEGERFATMLGTRLRARILIEASTDSEWVARCIEALGHEVSVADPIPSPQRLHRAAIAVFTRWTVPKPTPSFRATALMPVPVRQLSSDVLLDVGRHPRAPKPPPLCFRSPQPCMDSFHNHGPLGLSGHPEHLEHRLPGRRAGVQALLMQVEVHTLRLQLAQEPEEMLERAANAVRHCQDPRGSTEEDVGAVFRTPWCGGRTPGRSRTT